MEALRIYVFFFKTIFVKLFFNKIEYNIALTSLTNAHTYRIPDNINKFKAIFVFFKKCFKVILSKNHNNTESTVFHDKAMYCIRSHHAEFCIKYAKALHINSEKISVIIRDELNAINLSLFDKCIIIMHTIAFYLIFFFISLVKKQTKKISLIPLEIIESIILLKTCKKNRIVYLYYFSAYEKDANWIALLLKKNKIFCHKIPSSNPIKNFYPQVIADKFSFTAPFQQQEYSKLKHNWLVSSFEMWPNMGFQNLQNYTIELKGEASKNSIGIFTRGIWLRKLRGDSFLGVGEDDAEIQMLNYLKVFLQRTPEIKKIYILLHPIEKSNEEQYTKSKKYYLDFFERIDLIFIDSKLPSYEYFSLFDIGIASLSSVVFERLYCGYKCLLAPIDIKVKLYEDLNLENVIAHNKEQFFQKMKDIISISSIDYFANFKLQDYRINQIKEINA